MADLLTGVRLLLAAPLALAFAGTGVLPGWAVLGLLLVAIGTDMADGAVARSRGTASARGQLFDHATDFVFVTSGLAGVAYVGTITRWLPVLIVVAFTQYVADSYLLHRMKSLRMSRLGRYNGILYFVPLVVVAVAGVDPGLVADTLWDGAVGVLGWVLCLSTVASIADRAVAPVRERAG